jgi:phage gp36-like protein
MDTNIVMMALTAILFGLVMGIILGSVGVRRDKRRGGHAYSNETKVAVESVLDGDFRKKIQDVSRLKIEKEIDRDTEKLGEQLDGVSKNIDEYLKTAVEKQMSTAIGVLQKDIATLHDRIALEIKKTSSESDERSKVIIDEITKHVKDSQQSADLSLQKSAASVEEETKQLIAHTKAQLDAHKIRMTEAFTENMSAVVSHYVRQALGNTLTIDSQMDAILANLNENKAAIVKDITR